MVHNINYIKRSIILFCCFLAAGISYSYAQDIAHNSLAKISLGFVEIGSVKQVKATVTKADGVALKGVEVHFFIKKSFGLLPVGDGAATTDENGEALADFPIDIPGDATGNVTVIAKIEENDQTGELETSKAINWAVPTTIDHSDPKRALWASADNAPIPLVITVTSIVALVWGVIFYILYQLIAVKRAAKMNDA